MSPAPPGSAEDLAEAEAHLDTLLQCSWLRFYITKKHVSGYEVTVKRMDGDEVSAVGNSYLEAAERALVGCGEFDEGLGDA